ncbi:MAG: hypothetical protein KDC55_12735 [Ignavibacteriae bacterium]|nr:hypothetical protein [Ignavibacteriota bacterium]
MKKYTNILVALGVTLFLLIVGMKSEAEALCPTGYSTKTINMNVGGCIYEFEICYKCSPLGAGATKVQLGTTPTLITPGCVPTVPFNQVIDYILSQIQTPAFLFSEICIFNPNIPPCDGPPPPYLVTFYLPQCWQAEVIYYFGSNTIYFSPCSEDYCETTYSICVDGSGNKIMTALLPSIGSTPSCSGQEPPIPFINPSYPPHTKTPCYIYHTPCD